MLSVGKMCVVICLCAEHSAQWKEEGARAVSTEGERAAGLLSHGALSQHQVPGAKLLVRGGLLPPSTQVRRRDAAAVAK